MEFRIRIASPADADRIATSHLDSIRTLGPLYYDQNIVDEWCGRIQPEMYTSAMADGEQFFVAVDEVAPDADVLGFSSTHASEKGHRLAVYVRGRAARRGIGSALLREAERAARASGATIINVDASLAAIEFYRANGFDALGAGAHRLASGAHMACVFMQKRLRAGEVQSS
jgi:putative acetyltransferase